MSKLLKPLSCPFCGKQPSVKPKRPDLEGNAWGAVECVNKRCQTNDSIHKGVTVRDGSLINDDCDSDAYKNAAIKRWNKRATT